MSFELWSSGLGWHVQQPLRFANQLALLGGQLGRLTPNALIDSVTMPATSARVIHLWSAGITHHGAHLVLVCCSICSNAS